MRTTNVSTLISDSGYTRYHITTPLWLMFEEARKPHWHFPQGLFVVQFDDSMHETGTFTADTATYYSLVKLWQFDRNVRMRNIAGDRFVTQQLFWDQNTHKVYSDSFIHIERADRTLEGYGFESNEQMTTYTIRKPSGIFPTGDFVSSEK
jgi:LPS export ABC transporter protein LptC